MARLDYQGRTYTDPAQIAALLARHGIPYERWGVRTAGAAADADILDLYRPEVERLKTERAYLTEDLIALRPTTPGLDALSAKFDKEHHHVDDEVRFTVEGEGVFEIVPAPGVDAAIGAENGNLGFTAEPGDLIVIPAYRRHLFYLTPRKTIRCIRLFKTRDGWEAIYQKAL
jgi:1,2-dihydroxy-3-keto-5-methylthiopentene dioxygenase